MEPWYKVVTPRKEVREGRSFSPDEFAIHLEQVVARTAPEDYREPSQFFDRTCFTRALVEHAGMVLRRLDGQTTGTAPVLTLITQFGGGKTHTLTALYHLARNAGSAASFPGVPALLQAAGVAAVPETTVAVFVGNAWDPQFGRETPWVDIARQLGGDDGVAALGPKTQTTPPGTEVLGRLFDASGGSVLILFDEVLNFVNRHRDMADPFYAFIQNLTVAMTGSTHGAAVISLPRSQVEMTEWDLRWQERITKVVRRVAKDLIANDETEISEVIRRRLFQELGSERIRKNVARAFSRWCFERRAQLPPEWTSVDTASTEQKALELLQGRFETCYPFHPATLSVFQRKWQALPQYQQTRGTLAMLAQWISRAYRDGFTSARTEPLITIGSAPLEIPEFRSVVLGQLGESRLVAALDTDISGRNSHARALDADTKGPLRDIHRRTGTAILFESSGGQVDKIAHMPELRFALGEPDVDTTSVDSAAMTLETKAFYIRRVGSDGFRISHQPTLKKVVSDRRAALDPDGEVRPTMRKIVLDEFQRGASVPIVAFPADSTDVQDTPRLTLVVADPDEEWDASGSLRTRIGEWMRQRGSTNRLYPGALVWCIRKPGRDLRNATEIMLAWRRVHQEVHEGTLGADYDRADLAGIRSNVTEAEGAAVDDVWAGYRYVAVADSSEPDGVRVIDLGAGHASGSETLCGRVIAALKAEALLNESVGAGYIGNKWPPALKASGAWPLSGLRQSFLNGALTRLLDPDKVLRARITEFVQSGEFGLGSGHQPDGGYSRVWFAEPLPSEEVTFDLDVFLLTKVKAKELAQGGSPEVTVVPKPGPAPGPGPGPEPLPGPGPEPPTSQPDATLTLSGTIPPELWNRLGTKLIPKLRSGKSLTASVQLSVDFPANQTGRLREEISQILDGLGLASDWELD